MFDKRIISIFVDTWNEMSGGIHVSESTINHGWCYQIALVFQRLYGGVLYSPGEYHAWVKIGDLHFDTEHMDGVTDPLRLCHCSGREMSEEEFIGKWDKWGNSGKVRLDIVEEVVQRYQEEVMAA